MTEQQIDRERLRENAAEGGPWGALVLDLLDQLDQVEAERDWNVRSSRIAKKERIEANARAERAEQRIRDLTQEVRDERGAARDQMEQVAARDKRIGRLENRAASETARANAWRDKHRVMAEKRDAARRAWALEHRARRDAETRIKAVEDVLDNPIRLVDWDDPLVPATHVRRALDG